MNHVELVVGISCLKKEIEDAEIELLKIEAINKIATNYSTNLAAQLAAQLTRKYNAEQVLLSFERQKKLL